jgi:hypothetical protein
VDRNLDEDTRSAVPWLALGTSYYESGASSSCSIAQLAIWARERSPSLPRILPTWLPAVHSEIPSSVEIWRGVLLGRHFVGGGDPCAPGGYRRLLERLGVYPQRPFPAQDERCVFGGQVPRTIYGI